MSKSEKDYTNQLTEIKLKNVLQVLDINLVIIWLYIENDLFTKQPIQFILKNTITKRVMKSFT